MEALGPLQPTSGARTAPAARIGRRRTLRIPLPSLRLTVSERRLMLAVVDVLILNATLFVVLSLVGTVAFSLSIFSGAPEYFILLTVLWGIWASFFDCYGLPRTADASQSVWATGRAALLTTLVYLAIPLYTPHFPASRLSSFFFVSAITVSLSAWRLFYATVFSQPSFQRRVLVVGAGESGAELARVLATTPEHGNPYAGSGYRMIGFVDDDPAKADRTVAGMPVLGNRCDLLALINRHKVDLLVVAITHTPEIHPELFRLLLDCREQGIGLESMTALYEQLTGRVSVEHAGRDLRVVMPPSDSSIQHLFWFAKRGLDLVAGILGLMAVGFVAPWVALANAVCSPGPLFYPQVRVGRGGRTFVLYKFRSMIPDAENGCGAVWACEGDNRVTPVGRILRKVRLDELPQFWNVLRGDMSLVGPRPERPEFVEELLQVVPFYQVRHAVRPGITGWAQVRYQYGSSLEDSLVKLEYDLYYIKRQSVYLELSVLVKTAAVILGLKGR